MFKILTQKKYDELVKAIFELAKKDACQTSGIHSFVSAVEKVKNEYEPSYAYGGLSADIHNHYERRMMFDESVKFIYCKFCGLKKQENSQD